MPGAPNLSFGFNKNGFTINGKKFHPLNMSFKGLKLESDRELAPVDPIDILNTLTSLNTRDATDAGKINALKTIIKLTNP
ncbi:MAG TPA: hypothetical protein GXX36_07350 [Clostridiaceae bacterium]|nr:hypothetical protein [Clostridiaceae bacterium]